MPFVTIGTEGPVVIEEPLTPQEAAASGATVYDVPSKLWEFYCNSAESHAAMYRNVIGCPVVAEPEPVYR